MLDRGFGEGDGKRSDESQQVVEVEVMPGIDDETFRLPQAAAAVCAEAISIAAASAVARERVGVAAGIDLDPVGAGPRHPVHDASVGVDEQDHPRAQAPSAVTTAALTSAHVSAVAELPSPLPRSAPPARPAPACISSGRTSAHDPEEPLVKDSPRC